MNQPKKEALQNHWVRELDSVNKLTKEMPTHFLTEA